MNQELIVTVIGLLTFAFLLYKNHTTTKQSFEESDYLMVKYGLTENESRIFSYIADPIKRDQYLNQIIKTKLKK